MKTIQSRTLARVVQPLARLARRTERQREIEMRLHARSGPAKTIIEPAAARLIYRGGNYRVDATSKSLRMKMIPGHCIASRQNTEAAGASALIISPVLDPGVVLDGSEDATPGNCESYRALPESPRANCTGALLPPPPPLTATTVEIIERRTSQSSSRLNSPLCARPFRRCWTCRYFSFPPGSRSFSISPRFWNFPLVLRCVVDVQARAAVALLRAKVCAELFQMPVSTIFVAPRHNVTNASLPQFLNLQFLRCLKTLWE